MQSIPHAYEGLPAPEQPASVLVTGGSGYIAGWILVRLLQAGYRVRTTVRSRSRQSAVRGAVAGQIDPQDRLSVCVADLLDDNGWDDALRGCDYVIHVASPMGQGQPKADLTRPAREGTLRVLRAARKAGVRRVVVTSSAVAATKPPVSQTEPASTNESAWTDPAKRGISEYARSKTLAERAAWQFAEDEAGPMALTTILPGMVIGPVMTGSVSGSVEVISRLLLGKVPALPRVGFNVVDVRDLADLHVGAMVAADAAGQRFLGTGDFLWMADMARLLRENFGADASRVPSRELPDVVVRIAALFQVEARFIAPMLGQRKLYDASKAGRLLGWHARPASQAVLECARDLIRQHLV